MLCDTKRSGGSAEKMLLSNLLYLAQTTGNQEYQRYTRYAVQLMKKAKMMSFDRNQMEWEHPEMVLSRDQGCRILNKMKDLEGFYVFFYDGERRMECGTLNGITMLRDEEGWIPVRNDFMEEVMQTESFHMIGIEPRLSGRGYAGLVGIAKEIQEITKGAAEIIIDSSPGLYVIPRGQKIKNRNQ